MNIGYIGTYTDCGSEGIYKFTYDVNTGNIQLFGEAIRLKNPSYLIAEGRNNYLYTVLETEEFQGEYGGAVAAYSIDSKSGDLSFINCVSTKGKHPCHLTIDSEGRFLFAANYTEGSITVFPIALDGGIGEAVNVIKHQGSGPNCERQEKPHVHFVRFTPDNRYLCAVDLGIDRVMVYDFNQLTGTLSLNEKLTINLKPGSGPRHLTFSRDEKYVYVISELSSEIAVFEYCKEVPCFKEIQYISTLPANYQGENICAAIRLSKAGDFLYASNRGCDSITVFKVNKESGTLNIIQHISTGGKFPRDINIDPLNKILFAANQESDSVVAFAITEDGYLKQIDTKEKISKPVCITLMET